jgi:hypothetical protein
MQRKKMIAFLTVALVVCLLGFAISTVIADNAALQTVTVSVQSVTLSEIGTTSCEITLTVILANPSNRTLLGCSSNFNLFIQNTYIGHGKCPEGDLPAHAQTIERLSLTLSYAGLAAGTLQIIKNLIAGKQISLIIDGEIHARLLCGLIPIHQDISASYP